MCPSLKSRHGFLQQSLCSRQERQRMETHQKILIDRMLLFMFPHFKMKNVNHLKDMLTPGDSLVKIGLKDAYVTIPMN